ncbi:MAG: aminopeptidase P family protein [Deltaproteobacteria bacterium]|nr:aminopeptidase P family protein [Deltaproteobacteria bacterium]
MKKRRALVREEAARRGVDGFLVTDIRNIRYLSGFTGGSAYMLVTAGRDWFLTDSRYGEQARDEVRAASLRIYKKPLEAIAALVSELRLKVVGFESNNLTVDAHGRLRKVLSGVRLKPVSGFINGIRARKDRFEIEQLRASARLLSLCYETTERMLRPGVVESEVAFEAEAAARDAGAEGLAFDTIMASGWRGALPHGKASDKRVRKGELVVADMGVVFNGYNSDCTRTYCVGRAGAREREVYQVVLDAQRRAIETIRPGVPCSEVDRAARDYIAEAGYGGYFGHGTGHGVGLDIHEQPVVGPASKDALAEGMVITVEPGIYIPGWGGVRIEDMALVTKDGFEILTGTAKDLLCL